MNKEIKKLLNRSSNYLSLLENIFPWICLIVCWLFAVLYQLKFGSSHINSDMASEMVLANEMNKAGDFLLCKNWFYSTEVRVLYQHMPMRLGLFLFPGNWYLARVFGQALLLALNGAGFIYFLNSLGYKKAGVYGAAALMLPFGYWYCFHVFFSGHYLAHLILVSFCAGLIINITKGDCGKVRKVLQITSLALLAFLQGLSSVRMIMNLYAPFVITAFILFIIKFNKEPFEGKFYKDNHFKLLATTIITTLCCLIGYVINSTYVAANFLFENHNVRTWETFSMSTFADVFGGFIALFGYPYERMAAMASYNGWTTVPLFSLQGILACGGLVTIALLILATIRLFFLFKNLSFDGKIIFILFLSSAFMAVLSGSHLSAEDIYNYYYMLPVVPLAFAAVIVWIKNENFRLKKLSQYAICFVLLICMACSGVHHAVQFAKHPSRSPVHIQPAINWLVDNGYTQGYATFWHSNIITERTSGQIECWTMKGTHIDSVYQWLQKADHIDRKPEGKCFVLLDEFYYEQNKDKPASFAFNIYDDTVAYNDENGYTILVYDNVSEIAAW